MSISYSGIGYKWLVSGYKWLVNGY